MAFVFATDCAWSSTQTRKNILQNTRKINAWKYNSSKEAKDLIECSFQCIEFGPVPCLSFNLERSNRNVRICELSNTEKYVEPQKIHERPGYDYYGTEFQVSWRKPHYLVFILGC